MYELAVQNFLIDAHRDGCMFVLGLRIVVPTALRRLLCRLLQAAAINCSPDVAASPVPAVAAAAVHYLGVDLSILTSITRTL